MSEQITIDVIAKRSAPILDNLGMVLSYKHIRRELQSIARIYNYGKARAVSLKRPSPQLSRRKLRYLKQAAFLNATMKAVEEIKSNGIETDIQD